jgi:hypothetical protein
MARLQRFLVPFCSLLVMSLSSCDEATGPSPAAPTQGQARFDGAVDPTAETFVLKRIDVSVPPMMPVPVDLVGSNLQIDRPRRLVRLDVALRNQGNLPLYPPAIVWVGDFVPSAVTVLNANGGEDPDTGSWIFDYSHFLGPDEVLMPGATSDTYRWSLFDPGLVAFSFGADATLQLEPAGPVISGGAFEDLNENGIRERNEGPWSGGAVFLTSPDGTTRMQMLAENGSFEFAVTDVGLYRLRLESMVDCPTCITTTNPLEVVLVPGADGRPASFRMAVFGAIYGPCGSWQGPVQLTLDDPSSLALHPYTLVGLGLEGDVLNLDVAFGGCQPDHPFTLWAGREFTGSDVIQTWLVLRHDGLSEDCEAVWHRRLRFDVTPIQEAYVQDHGEPGPVVLMFRDFEGIEHELLYQP